jgi:hypothetical protein
MVLNRTRNRNLQASQPQPTDGGEGNVPDHGNQAGDLATGGAGREPGKARQRNAAKSKAGGGRRQILRRSRSVPNIENHEEYVFCDDDEPDIGKTLNAKDGKVGFVIIKGFIGATHFLVDIGSQVFRGKYSIKSILVCFTIANNIQFYLLLCYEVNVISVLLNCVNSLTRQRSVRN